MTVQHARPWRRCVLHRLFRYRDRDCRQNLLIIHKKMKLSLLFSSALLFGSALTLEQVQAQEPIPGQTLARQCSVCHGKTGMATDPEVPNLAGQSALYLEKSLKDYRSGARQDRRMSLIAQPLSDEQIAHLAAWYAAFIVEVTPPE